MPISEQKLRPARMVAGECSIVYRIIFATWLPFHAGRGIECHFGDAERIQIPFGIGPDVRAITSVPVDRLPDGECLTCAVGDVFDRHQRVIKMDSAVMVLHEARAACPAIHAAVTGTKSIRAGRWHYGPVV